MSIQENLKKGTVEMIILTLLSEDDMYGYQICQEMAARSEELFIMQEGSMYPTLYRLLERGYISNHREIVGRRRARIYYHLEPSGVDYLQEVRKEYDNLNTGIRNVFDKTKQAVTVK